MKHAETSGLQVVTAQRRSSPGGPACRIKMYLAATLAAVLSTSCVSTRRVKVDTRGRGARIEARYTKDNVLIDQAAKAAPAVYDLSYPSSEGSGVGIAIVGGALVVAGGVLGAAARNESKTSDEWFAGFETGLVALGVGGFGLAVLTAGLIAIAVEAAVGSRIVEFSATSVHGPRISRIVELPTEPVLHLTISKSACEPACRQTYSTSSNRATCIIWCQTYGVDSGASTTTVSP